MPLFQSEEIKAFKLPRSIDDAKLLGRVLSKYKESHFFPVVAGFFVTYVLLVQRVLLHSLSSYKLPIDRDYGNANFRSF